MTSIDPYKLLLAAKTSFAMIGAIYDALWQVFPNELIALNEENDEKLLSALCIALEQNPMSDPNHSTGPKKRFSV